MARTGNDVNDPQATLVLDKALQAQIVPLTELEAPAIITRFLNSHRGSRGHIPRTAYGWYGIGGPKNMPAEILDKLNKEINAGLADPKIKTWLANIGGVSMPMTPAEFGEFIAEDTEKWDKVVKFSGIKAG